MRVHHGKVEIEDEIAIVQRCRVLADLQPAEQPFEIVRPRQVVVALQRGQPQAFAEAARAQEQQLFAGILKRTVRSQDVVYRFGGEEFFVVLAPLTAAAACQVFERLRESIAGYDFPQIGTVTASLGYTRIRPHVDATTVIGEADQALYYAKEHGRNRICRFESIAAQLPAANATRHSDAELF